MWDKIWNRIRKTLYESCDILELVMAVIVGIGIVIAAIGVVPDLAELWTSRNDMAAFMEFLDTVLGVVIGIEFLKMLCKPNTANIIEALIFLIARHMIIETTTASEDMIAVVSICILFVFRRFMLATKPDKDHRVPNILQALKIAQNPAFQDALKESEKEEGTKIEQ